jgi:glycosyltransferase involved in cell wall biosynthesis
MKICFLVPWITKGRGGTENVGQMMANAMAARGHTVHIVTFDDMRSPSRWPLADGIILSHVGETAGPQQEGHLLMKLTSIAPDLLVGLHMNRGLSQYAKIAVKLNLPLVLSEHCEPRDVFDLGTNTPEEREVAFFAANQVHLVNPKLAASVPEHLLPRCAFIPNTVPPAKKRAEPGASKAMHTLLTVARLVPRKNLSVLLDAFARISSGLPTWRIQIVGEGSDFVRLKEQRDQLGLAERVVFEGHQDDIYPFYEAADIFTLPSTSEVFGLVMLEAMAHGLPVVAPRASIGAEFLVLHDQTGLLYHSGSGPENYSACLSRLMGNPRLRGKMGAAGAQRYEEMFGTETVFSAWEALFSKAVENFQPRLRPSRTDYVAVRLDDLIFGDLNRLTSLDQ